MEPNIEENNETNKYFIVIRKIIFNFDLVEGVLSFEDVAKETTICTGGDLTKRFMH